MPNSVSDELRSVYLRTTQNKKGHAGETLVRSILRNAEGSPVFDFFLLIFLFDKALFYRERRRDKI